MWLRIAPVSSRTTVCIRSKGSGFYRVFAAAAIANEPLRHAQNAFQVFGSWWVECLTAFGSVFEVMDLRGSICTRMNERACYMLYKKRVWKMVHV